MVIAEHRTTTYDVLSRGSPPTTPRARRPRQRHIGVLTRRAPLTARIRHRVVPARPGPPAIPVHLTAAPRTPVTTTLTVEQPPHAVHTDGPADDELLHELAEHGLRRYTAQVAMAIGTGPEAAW